MRPGPSSVGADAAARDSPPVFGTLRPTRYVGRQNQVYSADIERGITSVGDDGDGNGASRGPSGSDDRNAAGTGPGDIGGDGPKGPAGPGGPGGPGVPDGFGGPNRPFGGGRPGGFGSGGFGSGGPGGPRGPRRPGGPGGPAGRGRPATAKRPNPLVVTITVLTVLATVLGLVSQFWTEVLWFSSVGYDRVLWTRLGTQAGLFLVGGAIVAALVASSLLIGYRTRPVYAPSTPQQEALDRYRELIEPLRRLGLVAAPLIFAAFAGAAAASQWRLVLLWLNGQPFGTNDPTFGRDVGFFVFTLPWLQFLVSFLTMALVLALMAAALTHYVYGGLQPAGPGPHTTRAARVHLSMLGAALVLVRAASYWLERYDLTVRDSQRITGLTYTDQYAVLPTKTILAIAAVLCAGLFIATLWTSSWRLPVVGVSVLLVLSLLVGGLYPMAVQSLRVRPNEAALEAPFIEKNIEATRQAYGLSAIAKTQYEARTTATSGQLRADAATIPGIRILDPLIVSPTFTQMQGLRQYYKFPDVLDVDRYRLENQTQDTVVAARELDLAGVPQRNWVNDHTVYTHGYGLVTAYGNKRTADGEPDFFTRDIPPKGPLMPFEPRIYFGERTTTYSVVGAPEGATPREMDYQSAEGEQRFTYVNGGGVAMDNIFKRAAYAAKYREFKLLLSEQVGDFSTMLDYRQPRERVEKVAPWLTLDGNAYPSVVDGRVLWILDGYTTSSSYPYSKLQSLDSATSDALTARSQSVQQLRAGQINYIRNSVKVTVDAYDGSVKLYTWDDTDPVLKAWSSAFGNTLLPLSQISGDLMSHLRYPEDLFKVQRELLAKYHVTDPGSFFGGGEYWKVPVDPTQTQAGLNAGQPPYYLSIRMPDQKEPAFSLTTSFSPAGEDRPFLTGFLAVDSDAGSQAGVKREGYGKMRLLDLPSSTNVPGPSQVQNQINSSNTASVDFPMTLNNFINISQTGSKVQKGNLLTLPVGGGLLYVQPIYVSGRDSGYPLLQAVVVSFGNKIAWGKTLDSALDQLFGGNSGASAGDSDVTETPPAKPGEPTAPAPTPGSAAEVKAALTEVDKHFKAGQEALKKGDWTAYGKAQDELSKAIAKAMALQPQGGAIEPGKAATAAPSATQAASPAPATAG